MEREYMMFSGAWNAAQELVGKELFMNGGEFELARPNWDEIEKSFSGLAGQPRFLLTIMLEVWTSNDYYSRELLETNGAIDALARLHDPMYLNAARALLSTYRSGYFTRSAN